MFAHITLEYYVEASRSLYVDPDTEFLNLNFRFIENVNR